MTSTAYSRLQDQDFTRPSRPHLRSSFNQVTLNRFNASKLFETAMFDPSARLLPVTATVLFSISALTTLLAKPTFALSRMFRILAHIPISPSYFLKDMSNVVQQVQIRIEQAVYFTTEIPQLRNRSESDITEYAARYTQFFNTIWMILNDITIGMTFGTFLSENATTFADVANTAIQKYLIHDVIYILQWLNSWPAGLKLNTELSHFYSHSFVGLVSLWERVLQQGTAHTAGILYVVGLISTFGGISFAMSAFTDLLAIVTLHVNVCYYLSGLVYHRMLLTAGSLFNLFRGKRYNVLRNRVDSWEYDMDQLLFGTILFTLLAFLFPTVLVYYALFAISRFTTLLILASMEILLTLINHFPLFALMLRVKDPWRLPGGIYFIIKEFPNHRGERQQIQLFIENQPIPLSLLFFQYVELLKVLASYYNPLRLAWCLLKGEYLGAIPRYHMRYRPTPEKKHY